MPHLRLISPAAPAAREVRVIQPAPSRRGWRAGLPLLRGARAALRELRPGDAPALFRAISRSDVTRFISPPPATVAGFEQFLQ